MKNTHFLQQRRGKVRRISAFHVGCVAVSLALVWANPVWLQRALLSITAPVWRARAVLAQGTVEAARHLKSRDELEAENDRLTQENIELKLKGALYDEQRAEIQRLATLVGTASSAQQRILAHVIASPSVTAYDSFIIDAGSTEGVASGDTVFYGETLALGTIDLVTSHTSRVQLFSTPGVMRDVSVGTSTAHFEAIGEGGGMFAAQIPKDFSIAPGDTLTDRTLRATVGFVRAIDAHDVDAFQTIFAVMPINLFETREVVVMHHH